MPTQTAKLAFTYLSEGQSGAETLLNTLLNELDIMIQLSVTSDSFSPAVGGVGAPGDAYIVPVGVVTGPFTGQDNKIAYYYGRWYFFVPVDGMLAYNRATQKWKRYYGPSPAWIPFAGTGAAGNLSDGGLTGATTGTSIDDVTATPSRTVINTNFLRLLNNVNNLRTQLTNAGII